MRMAGDGPKSVLRVLRLPKSSTLTIGGLECFLRDEVAGLVSLISGTHEEYDFDHRMFFGSRTWKNLRPKKTKYW